MICRFWWLNWHTHCVLHTEISRVFCNSQPLFKVRSKLSKLNQWCSNWNGCFVNAHLIVKEREREFEMKTKEFFSQKRPRLQTFRWQKERKLFSGREMIHWKFINSIWFFNFFWREEEKVKLFSKITQEDEMQWIRKSFNKTNKVNFLENSNFLLNLWHCLDILMLSCSVCHRWQRSLRREPLNWRFLPMR